jgi:hypothetical protein
VKQNAHRPPNSRVWDDCATEVIAGARKIVGSEDADVQRSEKRTSAYCRRDEPIAGHYVEGNIVLTFGHTFLANSRS